MPKTRNDTAVDNKPSGSWTTRKLKEFIRNITKEVNKRIISYNKEETVNSKMDKQVKRLQDISTGNKGRGRPVGLGLSYKLKPELVKQAKALERFINWDNISPVAREEIQAKKQKAYNTFKRTYGEEIDYDDWQDMVESFGAIGDSVLNQFGSDNVAELYRRATSKGKINILKYMKETINLSKDKGWTAEDMMDTLYAKLKENGEV